jgi:uncharacterized membrane protein YciS (DUF1049 family)
MKKVKVVAWLLILGLIALVVFQNEDHFLNTKQSLRLNLLVASEYQTPELRLVIYYLVFFTFGILVTYAFAMPTRLRSRKAIKRMAVHAEAQQKEMAGLRSELARLKGEPMPDEPSGVTGPSITSPVKPA